MKFSVSFCSAFLLGMAHAQTPGGTVTDEDAAKSVGTGPYPAVRIFFTRLWAYVLTLKQDFL